MSQHTDAQEWLMRSANNSLPGVTDALIKHELHGVMHEFLEFTHAWQDWVDFTTIVGVDTYDLGHTDTDVILSLIEAKVTADDSPVTSGVMYMGTPGTITFVSTPTEAKGYSALVALGPSDTMQPDGFDAVPEWVWLRYKDVLLAGVLSSLMLQPAKPFTNLQLGQIHGVKFQSGKARARASSRKGHLYGGQRWSYPQNFATGRR